MQDDSNRVWSKRLHFGAALQKNALAELRELRGFPKSAAVTERKR